MHILATSSHITAAYVLNHNHWLCEEFLRGATQKYASSYAYTKISGKLALVSKFRECDQL